MRGLKYDGASVLIPDSPSVPAVRASRRASSMAWLPTCAITWRPWAGPAAAQASDNATRSSQVIEWHSPVVPLTNTVRTPFAARNAAWIGITSRASAPSARNGECVAATNSWSGR